jgi:branched-chain amino acid transport system substrate-binding protein
MFVSLQRPRFQVFVSSTYVDLKIERQTVIETVLALNCFPAGMEFFPASEADQMMHIRKVIDDCDYYVLIVGGRYGSTDDSGLSYTEAEYDYAKSTGVPILSFLHKDPGRIFADHSESSDDGREALKRFRQKVSNGRLVNHWATGDELGRKVATSLSSEFHNNPRPGWIRGPSFPTVKVKSEPSVVAVGFIAALSGENAALGMNMLKGIMLAIDSWNRAETKTKIELITADSKGDPTLAIEQISPLVAHKSLLAVISGFSAETKALLPRLNAANISVCSPGATNPKVASEADLFFRFIANDDSLAPGIARSLSDVGFASVTVLSDSSQYGEELANQFEAATDLEVLERLVIHDRTEASLVKLARRVSSMNPDVVFFGGYWAEAAIVVRSLRESKSQCVFVAGDGVLDQQFIELAGGAAVGSVVFATGCGITPESGFYDSYQIRFNETPGIYAAEAYDTATALILGIASGVESRPAMTKFLQAVDFEGITKRIMFDNEGEPIGAPVYAYRVSNGRFESLGPQYKP